MEQSILENPRRSRCVSARWREEEAYALLVSAEQEQEEKFAELDVPLTVEEMLANVTDDRAAE